MSAFTGRPGPLQSIPPIRDYQLADWYQERIRIQLTQFTQQLAQDDNYTTKVILHNGEVIWPRDIGYHNPNMLVIAGWDQDNNEVVLLSPHTTTQVVFTKHKKSEVGGSPRAPLGFHVRLPSEHGDPSADQSTPSDSGGG